MSALMKALAAVLCLTLAACALPGGGGSTNATTPQSGTVTQSPGVQNAAQPASTPSSTSKTTSFDTDRKLEYVDIYVEMGDPTGQRAIAPYILNQNEWMLVKCEMTSATSKHYRFQRVSTADGRSIPQIELFKQR